MSTPEARQRQLKRRKSESSMDLDRKLNQGNTETLAEARSRLAKGREHPPSEADITRRIRNERNYVAQRDEQDLDTAGNLRTARSIPRLQGATPEDRTRRPITARQVRNEADAILTEDSWKKKLKDQEGAAAAKPGSSYADVASDKEFTRYEQKEIDAEVERLKREEGAKVKKLKPNKIRDLAKKNIKASNDERRQLKDVAAKAPDLLSRLKQKADSIPDDQKEDAKLQLYRTMSVSEADAIMKWQEERKGLTEILIANGGLSADDLADKFKNSPVAKPMPIKNHLGDDQQAQEYYNRAPGDRKRLKITLKPGAHQLMYTPEFMALQRSGMIPRAIAEAGLASGRGFFPKGTGGEGARPGFVGLKSEGAQKDNTRRYSLSLGKKDNPDAKKNPDADTQVGIPSTQVMFQLFVESVEIVDDPGPGQEGMSAQLGDSAQPGPPTQAWDDQPSTSAQAAAPAQTGASASARDQTPDSRDDGIDSGDETPDEWDA